MRHTNHPVEAPRLAVERVRVRVVVSGRVQGVGYRQRAVEEASRLGATGWVRNLPGARIEALVEGPRLAVCAMLDWLRRGPHNAAVEECVANWEPDRGEFESFRIVR
jgi:acylphosphatase